MTGSGQLSLQIDSVIGSSSGAVLSDCESYRYLLWRRWNDSFPIISWIMLNPSTADASIDDPTIRRVINFSKRWGFGSCYIANLFALRATDPRELLKHSDPIGPECNKHIVEAVRISSKLICGWGVHGSLQGRDSDVLSILECGAVPYHLGLTKGGYPRHPLYLASDTEPVAWER